MVDLVKIRKKAKKKGEGESEVAAEQPAPVAETAPEPPPAPAPKPAASTAPVEPPPEPEPALPGTSKLDRFKAEAGRRREGMFAQADLADDQVRIELLTFIIANEHYAVDIERIVEIVTPRVTTRVPNSDESVVGIISLRGTIVTVIDVRRKLRHPAAGAPDEETRIVVVDFAGETVGFQVDRVLRVVKIAADSVEPHPVVHVSEQDVAVRGVFRHGNALTILLDLDKLLDGRGTGAKGGEHHAAAAR